MIQDPAPPSARDSSRSTWSRAKYLLCCLCGLLAASCEDARLPPTEPRTPPPVADAPPTPAPTEREAPTTAASLEPAPYQRGVTTIEHAEGKLHLSVEGVTRTEFPRKVEAYIYVRDASGNFIENLAPPYGNQDRTRKIWGAVKEQIGGKDCGDGSFQVEELREDTSPERTVMFVADYSGSMILTIGDVEKGLVEAIDELRRTGPRVDRWGLTKFDHRVRVVLPPVERDRIDASAHLRGLDEYGGATALRDAMMEGIRHLAATEDKKSRVLVVFTDGQENSSLETSWQPILDTALKSHVQIHAIGYGQVDGDTLRVIADRTGGSAYVLPTGASLAGLFRGIIHKTKVYYRATYTPCQGTERRTLSVALSLPGENKARAAATYTYSQEPVVFAEDLESKILLLFPFESASLAEATYNEQRLAMAADFLKARRNYRMILTGFTDSRGTELWNRDLGLRRATAAAGWLGAHGVERAQLAVRSEGKNRLVHDPDYPDAWKAFENRRVEFKLVAR